MLWATLWYTRNGAVTVTYWPFWYSCVGSMSVPAGPEPLIPNRLWSRIASALWPQPDSSIAWAIVTAAGMPYRLCMAMAPGATWLMNACWAAVPGTCVASAVEAFLVYDGADGDGEPSGVSALGACSPGITAVPAPRPARAPSRDAVPPRGVVPFRAALPPRVAARACDPCRAWVPCRARVPCCGWDPCRAWVPCRAWDVCR